MRRAVARRRTTRSATLEQASDLQGWSPEWLARRSDGSRIADAGQSAESVIVTSLPREPDRTGTVTGPDQRSHVCAEIPLVYTH
jgi:hypothetical protein